MNKQSSESFTQSKDLKALSRGAQFTVIALAVQINLILLSPLLLMALIALDPDSPVPVGIKCLTFSTFILRFSGALACLTVSKEIPGRPFRVGWLCSEVATLLLVGMSFSRLNASFHSLLFFLVLSSFLSLAVFGYLGDYLQHRDMAKRAWQILTLGGTTVCLAGFSIGLPFLMSVPFGIEVFLQMLLSIGGFAYVMCHLGYFVGVGVALKERTKSKSKEQENLPPEP